VETGIAPQYLVELDRSMLQMLVAVIEEKAEAVKNASRGRRA
jgi:hypothetical protein